VEGQYERNLAPNPNRGQSQVVARMACHPADRETRPGGSVTGSRETACSTTKSQGPTQSQSARQGWGLRTWSAGFGRAMDYCLS
jgi:hypothetical protein